MKIDPKIHKIYAKIREARMQIIILEFNRPSYLYYASEYGSDIGRKKYATLVAVQKRQILARKKKIKKLKETIQALKASNR